MERMTRAASLLVRRGLRTRGLHTTALVYRNHGEPEDALNFERIPLGDGEVKIRVVASTVNPADVNTVQGKYPLKPPSLPAVGGSEGVGMVVDPGTSSVLKEGSVVIPARANLGLWTRELAAQEADLHHLKAMDGRSVEEIKSAAMIPVIYGTAHRLLQEFCGHLETGDSIIQNGATSAVGQAVVQLAKLRGLKTINLIRDSEEREEREEWLRAMGADIVATPEHLKARAQGFQPKVAFNCVGGEHSAAIAKRLCRGGTIVTYGGMSREPVILPTPLMIFKDIQAKVRRLSLSLSLSLSLADSLGFSLF